jgi:hypothetical protein
MMITCVKIPKNQQSRLSPDVWMAAEAIARYRGMNVREAFENSVRSFAEKLAEADPEFRKVWTETIREGVEEV